eukprot:4166603-Prymnesium_polylepis.1
MSGWAGGGACVAPLRLLSQPLPGRIPRPRCLQIPLCHAPPIRSEAGPHKHFSARPRHMQSFEPLSLASASC